MDDIISTNLNKNELLKFRNDWISKYDPEFLNFENNKKLNKVPLNTVFGPFSKLKNEVKGPLNVYNDTETSTSGKEYKIDPILREQLKKYKEGINFFESLGNKAWTSAEENANKILKWLGYFIMAELRRRNYANARAGYNAVLDAIIPSLVEMIPNNMRGWRNFINNIRNQNLDINLPPGWIDPNLVRNPGWGWFPGAAASNLQIDKAKEKEIYDSLDENEKNEYKELYGEPYDSKSYLPYSKQNLEQDMFLTSKYEPIKSEKIETQNFSNIISNELSSKINVISQETPFEINYNDKIEYDNNYPITNFDYQKNFNIYYSNNKNMWIQQIENLLSEYKQNLQKIQQIEIQDYQKPINNQIEQLKNNNDEIVNNLEKNSVDPITTDLDIYTWPTSSAEPSTEIATVNDPITGVVTQNLIPSGVQALDQSTKAIVNGDGYKSTSQIPTTKQVVSDIVKSQVKAMHEKMIPSVPVSFSNQPVFENNQEKVNMDMEIDALNNPTQPITIQATPPIDEYKETIITLKDDLDLMTNFNDEEKDLNELSTTNEFFVENFKFLKKNLDNYYPNFFKNVDKSITNSTDLAVQSNLKNLNQCINRNPISLINIDLLNFSKNGKINVLNSIGPELTNESDIAKIIKLFEEKENLTDFNLIEYLKSQEKVFLKALINILNNYKNNNNDVLNSNIFNSKFNNIEKLINLKENVYEYVIQSTSIIPLDEANIAQFSEQKQQLYETGNLFSTLYTHLSVNMLEDPDYLNSIKKNNPSLKIFEVTDNQKDDNLYGDILYVKGVLNQLSDWDFNNDKDLLNKRLTFKLLDSSISTITSNALGLLEYNELTGNVVVDRLNDMMNNLFDDNFTFNFLTNYLLPTLTWYASNRILKKLNVWSLNHEEADLVTPEFLEQDILDERNQNIYDFLNTSASERQFYKNFTNNFFSAFLKEIGVYFAFNIVGNIPYEWFFNFLKETSSFLSSKTDENSKAIYQITKNLVKDVYNNYKESKSNILNGLYNKIIKNFENDNIEDIKKLSINGLEELKKNDNNDILSLKEDTKTTELAVRPKTDLALKPIDFVEFYKKFNQDNTPTEYEKSEIEYDNDNLFDYDNNLISTNLSNLYQTLTDDVSRIIKENSETMNEISLKRNFTNENKYLNMTKELEKKGLNILQVAPVNKIDKTLLKDNFGSKALLGVANFQYYFQNRNQELCMDFNRYDENSIIDMIENEKKKITTKNFVNDVKLENGDEYKIILENRLLSESNMSLENIESIKNYYDFLNYVSSEPMTPEKASKLFKWRTYLKYYDLEESNDDLNNFKTNFNLFLNREGPFTFNNKLYKFKQYNEQYNDYQYNDKGFGRSKYKLSSLGNSNDLQKIIELENLEKNRLKNLNNTNIINKYSTAKDLHKKIKNLIGSDTIFKNYKMYNNNKQNNKHYYNKVVDSIHSIKNPIKEEKLDFKNFKGCEKCNKKKINTDYYSNENNIMCKSCLQGGKVLNGKSKHNDDWLELKNSKKHNEEYLNLENNRNVAFKKNFEKENSHDKFIKSSQSHFRHPLRILKNSYSFINTFGDENNRELLTLMLGHHFHSPKETLNSNFKTNLNNLIINELLSNDKEDKGGYISNDNFKNFSTLKTSIENNGNFLKKYLV